MYLATHLITDTILLKLPGLRKTMTEITLDESKLKELLKTGICKKICVKCPKINDFSVLLVTSDTIHFTECISTDPYFWLKF